SEADVPVTAALFVSTVNEHVPGVVVDATKSSARPPATVTLADPPLADPLPVVIAPVKLQIPAPELALISKPVELSPTDWLPPESTVSIRSVEVDPPSAAITGGMNDALVDTGGPALTEFTKTKHPVRPGA